MDIDVYSQPQLETVFRVLRTALNSASTLEPRERLFLETYARITGHRLSSSDPKVIDARAVQIDGAHQRKRLVQLAAIAVLSSHPVKPGSVAFLRDLSRHLATRDFVVDVIEALARGQRVKVRMLAMRRAFRAMFKEAYLSEGLMGVVR